MTDQDRPTAPAVSAGSAPSPANAAGAVSPIVLADPVLMLLTDRRATARPLVDVVRAAVDGGARLVVLREKDLPRAERVALADRLRAVLTCAGGRLIAAGPDPLGGDAVHLPAAGPYPPPRLALVGRSCHDEAELRRLSTEDYATLSPAYPSLSKPGYGPPLGPGGLRRLIGRSPVPVIALGGVTAAAQAAACVVAGAAGVAVMGAVMHADDPAALVTRLIGAIRAASTERPALVREGPVPVAAGKAIR